jgi:hypothetical protein
MFQNNSLNRLTLVGCLDRSSQRRSLQYISIVWSTSHAKGSRFQDIKLGAQNPVQESGI